MKKISLISLVFSAIAFQIALITIAPTLNAFELFLLIYSDVIIVICIIIVYILVLLKGK